MPLSASEGLTRDRVLLVQEAVAQALGPVAGFKVACPPDAQIVIAPIMGRDIYQSPADISVSENEEVGVELEYAFRLIAPLPDPNMADFETQLRDAVELLPVFELVQSRLADPRGAGATLKMLDNQLNGAVVLGEAVRDWQDIDVTRADARLVVGEETLLDGTARVPGGDAFATLSALARAIGTHCGGLQPGHVVITGSLNGLPWINAPLTAQGEIMSLGTVSMTLM
ncbi:2-keto-4-pentenoate hydratase [uncultured Roseovarius sp.]|uniref:2-keto-4-pentenoate hydratase n=1 Tax=uncultured Roseovarius sp. TaxID=293344 RepID=UPI0026319FFE|nr:2-keto-4-pentenoate hydratase [uncultured Roseovarius sp.]